MGILRECLYGTHEGFFWNTIDKWWKHDNKILTAKDDYVQRATGWLQKEKRQAKVSYKKSGGFSL